MFFKELEGQLAQWLERLQEFEFEIIHRKGQSHRNADGLSRRLCEAFGCEYCAKIEKKSAEETEKKARIVLAGGSLEDWCEDWYSTQRSKLVFYYTRKRDTEKTVTFGSSGQKYFSPNYWSYWDSLVLKDVILYKHWEKS